MNEKQSTSRPAWGSGLSVSGGHLLLALVLVAGCGGGGSHGLIGNPGGSGSGLHAAGAGRVTITIQWPKPSASAVRAQAIPAQTASLSIRIEDPANSTVTLAPPAILNGGQNSGTVTQSFTGVRAGSALIRVSAFDGNNATGKKLAEATAVTTVVQDQTASVNILLAAIARIDVTPAPVVLGKGKTAQLSAAAKDASGNLLFVRGGALQWSSSDSSVATVDQTGKVTGVGAGTATITVRDVDPPNSAGTAQVSLDVVAPQIASLAPANNSIIPKANPPIAATIVDPAPSTGLNLNNALLQLDGAPRVLSTSDLTLQPNGSAALGYQAPNLAEGVHTVHFEIEDNAGNRAAADWFFSVDTLPPQIARVRSFNGQTEQPLSTVPGSPTFLFGSLPPEFRADVSDATSGVNQTPAAFTIDVRRILDQSGKPVNDPPSSYLFGKFTPDATDPKKGVVSFQRNGGASTAPDQPGTYAIIITATDLVGNVTPKAPIQFQLLAG